MDNVSKSQRLIDSETQTDIIGISTPLTSEVPGSEFRRRKSNRTGNNESNINDTNIEVVEENPLEYTAGLRLGSICAHCVVLN